MTTVTLYTALNTFSDNLEDIENALRANLQADLTDERNEAKVLGTSWVANEVRKLRIDAVAGTRPNTLRMIRSYINAQLRPTPNSITDIDIARAREYPITDLYAGKLRKHGTTALGLCPFHSDSNPSLNINTKKNLYYCFVCNEGGDAIRYYMKTRNVRFKEAVKALAGCA
jgi:hypothetical protein